MRRRLRAEQGDRGSWIHGLVSFPAIPNSRFDLGRWELLLGATELIVYNSLLFGGSTFISLYTVQYFKWNGSLPGYDSKQPRTHNIDPDKAAFSMAPVDEEAYAPVGLNDRDHDDHSSHMDPHQYDDHHYEAPLAAESHAGSYSDQGGYGRADAHVADNPFRQHDNPFESDSDYHPQQQPVGGRIYAPPSVNDDYDDDRPAHFPAADYDRVTR